jgi:hypothetical protein
MIEWTRCDFNKKHTGTHYAEFVFLQPVGSAGHVVHSGMSRHKMSTHYFSWSVGPGVVSMKSVSGHVTLKL